MDFAADRITRRDALARVAYLLGGAVSASTVAGLLAGCDGRRSAASAAWQPRTLSQEQSEMVLSMGEIILPTTDTPGARAARVDRFIDTMLTDYHPEALRARFVAGLDRADARARRAFGAGYLELPPERQSELVQALNREAFREQRAQPEVPPEQVARPREPLLQEHEVHTGAERTLPTVDADWDPEDTGRGSFFRTLKELVLVGYYTSEVGATQELRENPIGIWRADVPYSEIGRAWA
jgi:gluconate 2-dehydrogenase gamma chain